MVATRRLTAARGTWLLADSDAPGGGVLARLLRGCGAEVTTALTGAALLAESERRAFDVIALDPALVAPPGWAEVARRLRAADPTVGLVLISDAPSPAMVTNALRLCFDDVLAQPPTAGEVCATSADIVSRVRSRRASAAEGGAGASADGPGTDELARGAALLASSIVSSLGPQGGSSPPPLDRLLIHLEAALPAASSHRREPTCVAAALEGALALARPLLPPAVAVTGSQVSAVPRVAVGSVRLRRILASILVFAGQRAAASGRGRVTLRWGSDARAAVVTIADGATSPVTDRETPFRFPAPSLGADPLAAASLHFCRAALRAERGDLTAHWSAEEGLALTLQLPHAAGSGADWGPNLGASSAGSG